jgi:hypothetical protein
MHPIQDLFLEGFSYVLQIDMHFYMHSYLDKKIYSCKKWVLHFSSLSLISKLTHVFATTHHNRLADYVEQHLQPLDR